MLGVVVALACLIASLLAGAVAPGGAGAATDEPGDEASERLEPGLTDALDDGSLDRFVVELSARADLAALDSRRGADRAWGAYTALRSTARTSQAGVLAEVEADPDATATSHWLANEVIVRGDADLARRLAARDEVTAVRALRSYPVVEPVSRVQADGDIDLGADFADPVWSVDLIGADDAWDRGVLGSGVVIANVDSGVDVTHPLLVGSYRGAKPDGTLDHDHNWWDPTGLCGPSPCDTTSHGTHTMGSMVGGDGPGPLAPDIGVAPGARWIAAKGCEYDFCSEDALISAGEFLIAPTDLTGADPDPSLRPDIVNNSWGGIPGDSFYDQVVQGWRAAGIMPVFSSGNAGPFCESGGSPGDYLDVLSVGATDAADLIADFSSRGPSPYGKVNPDISAPGVDVLSSVVGGGLAEFSGTSMAAPHVAGALALVLSAEPGLAADLDALVAPVLTTAIDRIDLSCGGDDDGDPNNVYGEGRLDAAAAVELVATGGTLAGTVSDDGTGAGVGGASVAADVSGRTYRARTATDGTFQLFLPAGVVDVTVEAFGYEPAVVPDVEVVTDATTVVDVALTALPRVALTGRITAAEDGTPAVRIPVRAVGTPVAPVLTRADGTYRLVLPIGAYDIQAGGGCRFPATAPVVLSAPASLDLTVAAKLDDFGHTCRRITGSYVDAGVPTALTGDNVAGRLPLPFTFSYYGRAYTAVYVHDDGYLTFGLPQPGWNLPSPIPAGDLPNTAIYAYWADLALDDDSRIDYATIGTEPNRAFVVEYEDVLLPDRATRVDFEVKLWENGAIDLLYGDNPPTADGRAALVGIEGRGGTDGLQIGLGERILDPGTAIRIEAVPTGSVAGRVVDRNTGRPIEGASIVAEPGGRRAVTGADGRATLRLLPGVYDVTASSRGHVDQIRPAVVAADASTKRFFSLRAPLAQVAPDAVDAAADYGQVVTATVEIANPGTADLRVDVLERDEGRMSGSTPPAVLSADTFRHPGPGHWGPSGAPPSGRPGPGAADGDGGGLGADALPPEALQPVVDDPDDDAFGGVEIAGIRGGSDLDDVTVAIDVVDGIDEITGYVMFDTDQDALTGLPPDALFGTPDQDIGVDVFVEMFSLQEADPIVFVYDANYEYLTDVPAVVTADEVSFSIPRAVMGEDDGVADVAMVAGDFFGPTDWVPDVGHGTVEPLLDAPWLEPDATSLRIRPGGSATLTLTLGTPTLQPGTYHAGLVLLTNDASSPSIVVPVTFDVAAPAHFGRVQGSVLDLDTGAPVPATVVIRAENAGAPLDVVAPVDRFGSFSVFVPEGTWPVEVTAEGYLPATTTVDVAAGATTFLEVVLAEAVAKATLHGAPIDLVVAPGGTAIAELRVGNVDGRVPLHFTVGEAGGAQTSAGAVPLGAASTPASSRAPSGDPSATSARAHAGLGADAPIVPQVEGDVLTSWPTLGMVLPWGVGVTGDVVLSDPEQLFDASFTTAGEQLELIDTPWVADWGADMAYDAERGLVWQVNVGGDNGIYGFDPADGSVEAVVTGSPWGDISQRGLAYDGATDTFWIGGWNEGVVYHVAGPSHPVPGEVLGECLPDDPNISGLAYNPAFDVLWMTTNSDTDTIWLIDAQTCEAIVTLPHPQPGYNGAGVELDVVGNLWTVSQLGTAYLIESGVPALTDVPWLSTDVTVGTVPVGRKRVVRVTVDSTGLEPGVHEAIVVVQTDDPENRNLLAPVRLLVTRYDRRLNAGGAEVVDHRGDVWAADRPFSAGGFGYVDPGVVLSSTAEIAATPDDDLFRVQRESPTAYRFAVPAGRYRVELGFAELASVAPFGRIFDIKAEGVRMVDDLDVEKTVGPNKAHRVVFEVVVTDGRLDLGFVAQHGSPPALATAHVRWIGE